MNIEESIHVSFDESNVISPRKDVLDDVSDFLEEIHTHERDSKGKEMKAMRILKTTKLKQTMIFQKSGKLPEIIL